MKRPADRAVPPELLAAYVEGEVTPSQAAAVERALEQSPELRRRADDLRRIGESLAAPIADLQALDLTASVRTATRQIDRERQTRSAAQRPPWFRRWTVSVGLAAAGAAALALLVARPLHPPPVSGGDGEGMRPKSASAAPGSAPERWAGISAYRVADGRPPERLGGRIFRDDGLLFAYTNLGARPFTHLMIFAVDASGQVRWFHPAYQQAGTNPTSIPIEPNANVPLAEVVRHPFAAGPATLQALFSRRPLGVEEVEAWVARRPAANATPPWPDTYRQILTTSVERPR